MGLIIRIKRGTLFIFDEDLNLNPIAFYNNYTRVSVTSFQVLFEFINKNLINISKLATIADDETTAVESGSRARICADRPDVRRDYAPSALGVRHLLYCVKVFLSASRCLLLQLIVCRASCTGNTCIRQKAPLACGRPLR